MVQTLKNRSGASLIEICITLVIIAITTLIIMAFSRNTLLMNQDAKANDAAILAAEQKISDLATMTFSSFPQPAANDVVTIEGISFTRTWTITQSETIVVAKVIVSWNSGKPRQITLAGAIN